ncbi:hypothetical protein [Streptomyces californicus]
MPGRRRLVAALTAPLFPPAGCAPAAPGSVAPEDGGPGGPGASGAA